MNCLLLDTNAYSHLLTGNNNVLDALSSVETVYVSIFVLGELYSGFAGGTREKENKSTLVRFLGRPTVKILNATYETAEIFGMIKNQLKNQGTPLPINDIWIASHCIETGTPLLTFDAHFAKIPGLRLWNAI